MINVVSSALLLRHMRPISVLAAAVEKAPLLNDDLTGLRVQLVADAAFAIVALLAATTISVYKPWGKTQYGLRKTPLRCATLGGH